MQQVFFDADDSGEPDAEYPTQSAGRLFDPELSVF